MAISVVLLICWLLLFKYCVLMVLKVMTISILMSNNVWEENSNVCVCVCVCEKVMVTNPANG
jgi:hypothetical protein